MASRHVKLISAGILATMAAGGWFLYNALAAQAQGALAQAPLNTQVQVPPAFIMAVDDSGSMLWETLNNTRDGVFSWSQTSKSFYSGSTPLGYGAGNQDFHYVLPPYGRGNQAIPPIDSFGFAKSPDLNPGYFDPRIEYPAWKNANGTDYRVIDPANAPVDPRPTTSPAHINSTLNLTADAESTANNWRFRVRSGMVLPEGTRVRGSCNGTPSNISTGASYQSLGSDIEVTQDSCDLHFSYFPATFFLEDPATLASEYGYAATPLAVTSPSGGFPGTLYKFEIRPENFASTVQYDAAIQNFANWFSFYRVRREALIGGATNSLVDVRNMKVGWFRIHNRVDVVMRDMSDTTQKQALFTEILQEMRASSNTPNRQAVRHLGQQFKRTDDGAPVQLSCQKNAGMLFTDGYINDGSSPSVGGNLDGVYGPPFADSYNNTMADIVIPYYYESLRPGLEQSAVPVPPACSGVPAPPLLPPADLRYLDCQRNLHMNFYGVTLGTLGAEFGVNYHPDPIDPSIVLPDPYLNPPTWQSRQNLVPAAVDEMWHATLNTRGGMFNAKTPAEITAAMRRILLTVSAGASPSGTLALTGSRISTRSLTVQPSYEVRNQGTDWFGELSAYQLSLDLATRDVTETQIWEASARLAAMSAAARGAQTWFGAGASAKGFNDSNITSFDMLCDNPRPGMSRCTASQITSLLGINLADAINYLMGDSSKEVGSGGVLRDRTTVLGDIVNSTPVVSAPTDDYGYRTLPPPYGSSYDTYMTTKKTRPAMVYVGANDGMLHAFHGGIDADGDLDTLNGGKQQFAYIPRAVLGHMGNLLFPYNEADSGDQKFDHRYFVDGPVTVSDAYYDGGWKTVLVGTAGAGGRTVFGLNVSSPTSFAASHRLWEVDDQHGTAAVRNNIGHVLGKPVIVPVKTASGGAVAWKAIFGNGYNSNSGKAVLFVVDVQTGAVQMTEAVEPGAPSAGTNGLGNIVVVDRWGGTDLTLNARDGFADTVYAADQKGAVWKFDLRTIVSSISTPVFTTDEHVKDGVTYRQPIIGGLTATAGRGAGVMLLFGTGSFSFINDATDDSKQAIYGVLDIGLGTTLDSSDLFERTIAVSGTTTRTISPATMGAGYSGWYVELPAGERSVGYPRVASGVLFIPTYAPTTADGCSTQGTNWLYGLNTRTGAPALDSVRFGSTTGPTQGTNVGAVVLNTLGTSPVKDVGLTVLSRAAPPNPGVTGVGDDGCWMRITVPGMADAMFVPYPCGRQSWRQLQ